MITFRSLWVLFCYITCTRSFFVASFLVGNSQSFKSSSSCLSSTDDKDIDIVDVAKVEGVTLKMAFDEDYAVADASATESVRFTSPPSLDLVHQLRRNCDCVLVGKGTVVRDDCTLTVRRVELFPRQNNIQPARVVIDSNLEILSRDDDVYKYALLKDGHRVIIYHSCDETNEHEKALQDIPNLALEKLPKSKDGNISVKDVLQNLRDVHDINHCMVEGGPATALPFLQEKFVDRAMIVKAPMKFNDPVVSNINNDVLIDAGLELIDTRNVGDDVVEYWVKSGQEWPTKNVADWPM